MVVRSFRDTGSPGCWAWLTRSGPQISYHAFKNPPAPTDITSTPSSGALSRYSLVGRALMPHWRVNVIRVRYQQQGVPIPSVWSVQSWWQLVYLCIQAEAPITTDHFLSSGTLHTPPPRSTDRSSFIGFNNPIRPDRAVHWAGRLSVSLGHWSLIRRPVSLHASVKECVHCSPAARWMKKCYTRGARWAAQVGFDPWSRFVKN